MTCPVLLEVCVGSVDDAVAAAAAGADRLEVNCAVSLGGLTPSMGMFAEVRQRVNVPLIAMVRPRPGGFSYSETEFEVMIRDAEALLAAGADGLALGVLTDGGEIDRDRSRKLTALCVGAPAVFHRAFDLTPDPFAALDCLIELGFRRVMTSGQAASAVAGAETIAALVRHAAGRIEVLPAGGIRPDTVVELLDRTGCDQVHVGVRTMVGDFSMAARPAIRLGRTTPLPEGHFDRTDEAAVAALRSALTRRAGNC
jgi:copper homeostasis protein